MKVVRTDAPAIVTVRLARCELAPLRCELHEQIAVVLDSLNHARDRDNRPSADASAKTVTELQDELLRIARILDQAESADNSQQGALDITGPIDLIGDILLGASLEAVERLRSALRIISGPPGCHVAGDLRTAARTAHAAVDSLCDWISAAGPAMSSSPARDTSSDGLRGRSGGGGAA